MLRWGRFPRFRYGWVRPPENRSEVLLPIHPGWEPPLRYAWLCSREARLCAGHEFFFEKTIGGTMGLLRFWQPARAPKRNQYRLECSMDLPAEVPWNARKKFWWHLRNLNLLEL